MSAAGPSLPPSVQAFVDAALVVGDLGLPQWYPEPGGIDAFQVGYRSHGHTGEDLSSEAPGQWHPAWLAVAANYFRDPYFIDLREADAGYPVWWAPASAGRWTPSPVAASIERFGALLQALAALGDDPGAMLARIEREPGTEGAPWREIRANLAEAMDAPEEEEASAPLDPAHWTRGALVLRDAGARRVEVAQCLVRLLGVAPARALALLKALPLELCSGFQTHLEADLRSLRALGATVDFVPAGTGDAGPVASPPHEA
jgi:hypothetical protein